MFVAVRTPSLPVGSSFGSHTACSLCISLFVVRAAPTARMVAVEGSPNDLPKSLRDRDRGATNWPPCERKIVHRCRDIDPHIYVIGGGGRLDETAPRRNGGIKLSGLVLVIPLCVFEAVGLWFSKTPSIAGYIVVGRPRMLPWPKLAYGRKSKFSQKDKRSR